MADASYLILNIFLSDKVTSVASLINSINLQKLVGQCTVLSSSKPISWPNASGPHTSPIFSGEGTVP